MNRGASRWIALGAYLVAILLALGGCRQGQDEVKYNGSSGVDGRRDTAPRIYLGTSEDDHCDAKRGDNEDWRKIHVREPGILRVSVGVDNTGTLDADLFIHDGFGRAIDRLRVNGNDDFYEFRPMPVTTGRYYFRIVCNDGDSVYTLAVTHTPERPEEIEPSRVYVLREERKPKPTIPKRKRKTRRAARPRPAPKPDAKPKPSPKPDPKPTAAKPPPNDPATVAEHKDNPLEIKGVPAIQDPTQEIVAPPPPEEQETIVGTVILVTPGQGDDGETKVTIRDVGTEKDMNAKMVGSLQLDGGRRVDVRLYKCEKKRCFGTVDATKQELESQDLLRVEFLSETKRR